MLRALWYLYLAVATLSFVVVVYIAGAFLSSSRWTHTDHALPAYGDDQDAPLDLETETPQRARILAINGGSMLGLADLVVLSEIEERSGKQIYELFDFFAGSSTGAIVSTLLLLPQDATGRPMSAKEALDLYEKFGTTIFTNPLSHRLKSGFGFFGPTYESSGRIEVAEDLLSTKTFSDLLRPAMFPSYSVAKRDVHLFRNWRAGDASLLLSSLIPAVTSAPTIFPFVTLQGYSDQESIFGDAALVLNAPAEMAYLQARSELPDVKDFVVVIVDTHKPLIISEEKATQGGLLQWSLSLVQMVLIGEARVARDILTTHSKFETAAVDLDVFALVSDVQEGISSYGTDEETISTILAAGHDFVAQNGDLIDETIQALEDKNDETSKTSDEPG
ncbi:MAG: patatin-like phospholipase family protein [Pseudomonadota bacterium]